MPPISHTDPLARAAEALSWPTVSDLAAQTGIAGRTLRRAIADGHLPALRLNVLRVSPDDFAGWFAARQK